MRPGPDGLGVDGGHRDIIGPDIHLRVVDVVAGVDQDDVIDHVLPGRGADSTTIQVEDAGRCPQPGENWFCLIRPNVQTEARINPEQGKLLRGLVHCPADEFLRYLDCEGLVVDIRPSFAEDVTRFLVIDLDAHLGQDLH
jgi:hypothetical protein